ncbi:MAG: hypothetical protein KKB31_00455, partial [Nanoarchaeota archaeon]|nr:hypothetical protein [Nanoarchaeota archaeon]
QQQELFKENIDELLTDFELLLDFDGDLSGKEHLEITKEEAVNRALKDLITAKKFLDSYGIRHHIIFSGNRGFHVIVKLDLDVGFKKKYEIANKLLMEIKDVLNLDTLDAVGELGIRKVSKTVYSLVSKNEVTNVCLPLDDRQISNFNLSDMEVGKVMQNIRIKDRGVLERHSNQSKEQLSKNFKKMLEDLEI